MALAGPSSAPASENLPGLAVSSARIQSLEEDLAFQQTILTSLEDTLESAQDEEAKLATKRKIVKLKKQLSEARGVIRPRGNISSKTQNIFVRKGGTKPNAALLHFPPPPPPATSHPSANPLSSRSTNLYQRSLRHDRRIGPHAT